jgi:hypothetical protein
VILTREAGGGGDTAFYVAIFRNVTRTLNEDYLFVCVCVCVCVYTYILYICNIRTYQVYIIYNKQAYGTHLHLAEG